jgi:ferredoxin
MRELASGCPESGDSRQIKPFAVFGLKECDLRSIEILDKVFLEEDFEDALYVARRENMFIISSDCREPGESCFCNLFDGRGHCDSGFDLNVSAVKDGFVIKSGSSKGEDFIDKHSKLFADIPEIALAEIEDTRAETEKQLAENNKDFKFEMPIRDVVEKSRGSEIFDVEAKNCIECQACTRVCPTCHCFYLYDTKEKDYFGKMKMWDSCMRMAYAAVAGGENPNKVLGDRIQHRLLHKFVYFLDRYGLNMCVGCGRCVDADAGGMDLREVLKKLGKEVGSKAQVKSKKR